MIANGLKCYFKKYFTRYIEEIIRAEPVKNKNITFLTTC